MIRGFQDKETEKLFNRRPSKVPQAILRRAFRKLRMLHAALELKDLATPPGNRLEPLTGAREGQHSIRINDQFRVCFVWEDGNAYDVEIVDYHKKG